MATKGKTIKALDVVRNLMKDAPGALRSGDSLSALVAARIPSNVFTFDLLTGGGVPENKITMFSGPESSGKTTHAMRVAKSFLEVEPNSSVAFLDFEQSYEDDFSGEFIPDKNRFYLAQPDYGEQGIDWMMELGRAEDVGLIIVDSLAAMFPTKEAEASASDDHVGLQARLINKMLRKMIPIMSQRKHLGMPALTLILINQLRAKIGSPFMGATSTPGGRMLNHMIHLHVKFANKGYKKIGKIPAKTQQVFTLEKNKVGIPKRSGEFSSILVPHDGFSIGDVDELDDIVSYAKQAGVITREGNKWVLGENLFNSQRELTAHLQQDGEALVTLKETTLDTLITDVFAGTSEDSNEEEESA